MYLLTNSWLEEPPATLPDDDQELAALARVSMEEWVRLKPLLIHQFQKDTTTGRLVNERLMAEWNKQQKRKSAGSKGGSKTVANRLAASENEIEIEKEDGTSTPSLDQKGASKRAVKATALEVLSYLNQKAGRQFRETETNLDFISARLSEPGVDLEGIKKMIDRQVARWKGTPQEEYLRPETLFNRTKFDGYYAAREAPIAKDAAASRPPESKEREENLSAPRLL
jgi:uncharacterized phage protein (TIGR02220 family)